MQHCYYFLNASGHVLLYPEPIFSSDWSKFWSQRRSARDQCTVGKKRLKSASKESSSTFINNQGRQQRTGFAIIGPYEICGLLFFRNLPQICGRLFFHNLPQICGLSFFHNLPLICGKVLRWLKKSLDHESCTVTVQYLWPNSSPSIKLHWELYTYCGKVIFYLKTTRPRARGVQSIFKVHL
jgi:hypothetical protein